jgi:formylmethanofuran dehydrogenase subunit E
MPDNYDLWLAHELAVEDEETRLPVCDMCGSPIWDDYYYQFGDEIVCEDCLTEWADRYRTSNTVILGE